MERTALHMAAEAGDREGVRALLELGANPLEERKELLKSWVVGSKKAEELATGEAGDLIREAGKRAREKSEESLSKRLEELEELEAEMERTRALLGEGPKGNEPSLARRAKRG